MSKKQQIQTSSECEAALAALEEQFLTPKNVWVNVEKHVKDLREWITHIHLRAERGEKGDIDDARLPEYEQQLADAEHDASLVLEWRRLHVLREKLIREEERALRAELISDAPSVVPWPDIPEFDGLIEMPEAIPGLPFEVSEFLSGIVKEVNAVAERFPVEPTIDIGVLGDLKDPVTAKAVDELRAARRAVIVGRANNAKRYLAATNNALKRMMAYDAETVTVQAGEHTDAKAAELAKQIEADATKAGLDPYEAKCAAANAPKLNNRPNPGAARALEGAIGALLIQHADRARDALEKLLALLW